METLLAGSIRNHLANNLATRSACSRVILIASFARETLDKSSIVIHCVESSFFRVAERFLKSLIILTLKKMLAAAGSVTERPAGTEKDRQADRLGILWESW